MTLFVPFRRATLLIPSGSNQNLERKHLFVLLTDPIETKDFDEKHVLLVNITSVPEGLPYDSTCVLKIGEHRFVKHDSYVFYAKARIESANKLLQTTSWCKNWFVNSP